MPGEKYEVVISGVGGVFPECHSFHEFRELLFSGKSGVTVDNRRWPVGALDAPPGSGKIPNYKLLDSTFFGMTPGLTDVTDPLTRLTLEKSIEALIDAGVNPSDLSGSNTGVMVGSCISESEFIQLFSLKKLAILGANRAMQANRISFYLNLTGPSYQLDNTWVGGIQCLDIAKGLVEEGSLDGCIVCVANLTISPCVSKQMQGLGVLSTDEFTRSFSSDASGYVRSEAVVAFYIQRLQDAKRSYGSIVEVGLKTFGGRKGIFAENCSPEQFQSLMEAVYGKVDSNLVGYVEADGSGVKALDAMECSVLKQVFLKQKKRSSPLLVGSVKSVVGHAEASSALVSVSKALVSLDSGLIPANLNYAEPNPNAEGLKSGEIKVVTETTPLPSPLVGVTSIGLGSSFGHVVLKQHEKKKEYEYHKYEMYRDGLPRLIAISGRTEEGLRQILKEIKSYPADEEFAGLFHEVYKTNVNRHTLRGYVLTPDTSAQDETENLEQVEYYEGVKKPIWFIFSGMGSQWNGMGTDLLRIPLFRQSMERLDAVLKPHGVDLFHILTSTDKTLFDNILNSFVGIAACQIGLVDILFALGITPDGIVGHSVGELGCAYADGCFTAEQMILAAHARGKASIETDTIDGKMAAIGLGYKQMKDMLADYPTIEIACHNASDSCTLSGPSADVEALVESLVAQGIFARAVNVANIAYHSRYIAPAAPRLLQYLKKVIPSPKPRSSKWISSSILEDAWGSPLAQTSSAEYHTNNLLSSVFFEEASAHIPANAICIEIAPHGLLQAILKRSLAEKEVVNIPLTLRGVKDGVKFILNSIGKLYLNGLDLNLAPLYPEVQYPVSRGTKPLGHFVDWEHGHEYKLSELEVQTVFRFEREIWISITDHMLYSSQLIHGAHVLPSASLLLSAFESLPLLKRMEPFDEPLVLQGVRFMRAVRIPTKRALKIYTMISKGSGYFEMLTSEGDEPADPFMSGYVNFTSTVLQYDGYKFTDTLSKMTETEAEETVLGDEAFAYMRQFGLNTKCQCIKQVNIYQRNLVHAIIDFDDWLLFLDNIIKVLVYLHVERHSEVYLPRNIESILIDKRLFMNAMKEKHTSLVDVYYDLDTKVVQCPGLHIFGFDMKPVADIPLPNSVLNLKNLAFVPYENPAVSSASQYAVVCLQLFLENIAPVEKGFKVNVNLISIDDPNNNPNPITNHNPNSDIIRILNLQPNIEHKILDMEEIGPDGKIKTNQQCYNLILCQDSAQINQALKVLTANRHSHLLVSVLKHEHLTTDPSLGVVSSAVIEGNKFLFLKNNSEYESGGEKDVVFSLDVNNMEDGRWRCDLKEKIEHALQDNSLVYIVMDSEPACNLNQFIKRVFMQDEQLFKCFQLFRFFLILDHSAPLFSLTGKFYREQIDRQLRINIFKRGRWGSEKFLLSECLTVETFAYDGGYQYNNSSYLTYKTRSNADGLDIKYLCISNKHLVLDEPLGKDKSYYELGPLEYAGISPEGDKVIGLAPFNKGVMKIQQDPILNWTLPTDWSLEDGATVPLPYSIAYYVLSPKFFKEANRYDYILLSTGLNAIGLAFLNIFIHRRKQHGKVILCVKNRKHRDYITQKYGQYIEENYLQVLLYSDNSFEIDVMFATKGVGVNLVINSLSGRHLKSALKCTGFDTRVVHLNGKDASEQTKIGMSVFLACVGLSTFGSDDLLALSDEEKVQIKDAVTQGLKSGVVRPIPRRILTGPHTGQQALEKLNSASEGDSFDRIVLSLERERPKSLVPVSSVNVKYAFEPDSAWLDLAEFLLLRGARHLLVAIDKTAMSCGSVASRKLNGLLSRYPTCDIQLTGATLLDTEEETKTRLAQSCAVRALSAVFLLHVDSAVKLKNLHAVLQTKSYEYTLIYSILFYPILFYSILFCSISILFSSCVDSAVKLKNLHSVLQTKSYEYTLYMSIYSNDSSLCDQRKASGYPTVCIQSEGDDRRIQKVLDVLDALLCQVHVKPNASGSATMLVDEVSSLQHDKDYILLQNIKSHLPESLEELEELADQIPSVPCWEEVQTRTSRLADSRGSYPIFLIPGLRPHTKLLKKFTESLYHPCFELGQFNLKTFNLVADSWGGLLALHIAKRLTQDGRYVRLSLLDAAPATIQSWSSYFQENLEIKLLSKYFPISYKDKQALLPLSWQDKLSYVLPPSSPQYAGIATALTTLATRLRSARSSILNTEKDVERMPYVKVLLLRPEGSSESDSCNLKRICSGKIVIHVGDSSDYGEFVSESATALQVNDHFLYDYPEAETPLYFVREKDDVYECKLLSQRVTKM
ncbi:hypothetical protein M8J75_015561 [Diaphorina citri]|nr:hypothetical protein M8J75_015561 [Diaphorina citri]